MSAVFLDIMTLVLLSFSFFVLFNLRIEENVIRQNKSRKAMAAWL